ncbi:MAG TPA: bifunctional proline dehydrogenase/L-glutamate gamma-semialdehyde dehydrogenase PutA [Stellaceae bacterium]|nr:bifunctional proline dehydrogenase/L-glutamate gamma-semialdehyde dehydrogenase PutA [Stellaceae bacterium]
MGLVLASPLPHPDPLRAAIRSAYREDEATAVARILALAALPADMVERIGRRAHELVAEARRRRLGKGGIDALLHEYALSTPEGIALMCLAEALLRIPDAGTVDRLIRDKLAPADWARHLGHSDSLLVNASTWALMLTGRLMSAEAGAPDLATALRRLVARSGEPVVRQAVTAAIRVLARQFVMGRTIDEALARAKPAERRGYRHSYDMLGEAARTAVDARRYFAAYEGAIAAIGGAVEGRDIVAAPGISVKLSALHPRYEESQRDRAMRELLPSVAALARHAKAAGIGFTIDAEEADRLDLSLALIAALAEDPTLAGWNGLGLAVQAYQKRAVPLVDWLVALARSARRRLMVRLVKGAYWDSEIKRSQERGLDGYPVFTRKVATDVSYLASARKLLAAPDAVFPQFATHNAHTLAAIVEMAGERVDYEFQRLHGMGEALYEQVVGADHLNRPCRVYAPVGGHEDLLAYLVRRLLENGANTSFVNRLVDEQAPIAELIADPVARLAALPAKPHPRIPLPRDLYGPARANARGIDLSDPLQLSKLAAAMDAAAAQPWWAGPIIGGSERLAGARAVRDPSDHRREIGTVVEASAEDAEVALSQAAAAASGWDAMPAEERARVLERAADLFEARTAPFMTMIVREGGRTIPDALAEVREAIDYCRYYADRARADFAAPRDLPGPTGESNQLELRGRGVFLCIAPWNFPLAIFTGQIVAALATGNAAIAKPAEQTPLIGAAAVRLLHEAGVPADVLHLLPGDGPKLGARLVGDQRIAGIAFTGSTETARTINRALAARPGPIIPFIAETGGQNALIADSSALPEQLVADVIASAFNSAGQRCSALRVLFVQEDIAPGALAMLEGAMHELAIGDPGRLSTDVGPVIDEEARAALLRHAERMARDGRLLCELALPAGNEHGTFFAPRAFEIERLALLEAEVFGPILHVIRWHRDRLDAVLDAVTATGYGLTLGIHSRLDETVRRIHQRLRVGNTYVNRNIIGAVVGVQPFGGEGLSGTGPKAGGPHYLHRFATERTLSIDTTAAGGNATLMSLQDEPA